MGVRHREDYTTMIVSQALKQPVGMLRRAIVGCGGCRVTYLFHLEFFQMSLALCRLPSLQCQLVLPSFVRPYRRDEHVFPSIPQRRVVGVRCSSWLSSRMLIPAATLQNSNGIEFEVWWSSLIASHESERTVG